MRLKRRSHQSPTGCEAVNRTPDKLSPPRNDTKVSPFDKAEPASRYLRGAVLVGAPGYPPSRVTALVPEDMMVPP